ncbi:glutamate-5-semialdehyde dehydrogenase [Aeromicrobium sp. 636]|uniref:Gamma-glutamyl phosphate reductase n=1 Tax=Aeromicrobium senzhongii TaxID=2663859 RepID=A0A8I0ET71_9ACTN|nr:MULTISPECIES: glutamate-5-semialdehyde dehydrogenase [Aeromicrobium]MBC9225735.1 glutamate-5-semialdehyde dehydrogenase [Aeromicrobium senzhongii]MCQ3997844.1 glutamate-5-semialdehyde dehydrogenase [Aeromicrobium sp. 636]MTB87772.1 glutamate-5-semialdehyde dehydrogenase [Aeromicrobium senzhongii]QNL95203.1 glutamate-5-semialdehyde dehydrogenase [Aeromicrobium senzhongii]
MGTEVREAALRARDAARVLALATRKEKDAALTAMAEALVAGTDRIVAANAEDVAEARAEGTPENVIDRLALDVDRVAAFAQGVRDIAALPDPIGEVVRGSTLPNGLQLQQIRVPMGVIGMIYEGRPNVTADAAAICLKAGSASLLRGSRSARRSNAVIARIMRDAVASAGLPADAIQAISAEDRSTSTDLMTARGLVDLVIPRGGAGLIRTVVEQSTVPVIETGTGNVHVYVDADADLDMALDIVINSKTHRTSVCNAAESLLVHRDVADEFLPRVVKELQGRDVVIHGDAAFQAFDGVDAATDDDYATEYLASEISAKVVDSLDEAVDHVRRFSSGHTEAIVTRSLEAARRFTMGVDSAAVMVNASTRFTDGGEFGFGAEIGISTQKLHARGPMGLTEMTTTTYVVTGAGQTR